MTGTIDSLPSDLAAAHAMILAERAARLQSEARASRSDAFSRDGVERRGVDCKTEAGDRKASAHALWRELGTQGAASRPTGDAVGRRRGGRDGGRTRVGTLLVVDHRQNLRAQAAGAQSVPRASAARASCDRGAAELPLLRFDEAVEARRGCHRDARGRPSPVEVDPARPGPVLLPAM